jgi:hypothetical protein
VIYSPPDGISQVCGRQAIRNLNRIGAQLAELLVERVKAGADAIIVL